MNKNALIPDYDKSGEKGKERKLTETKTGKPRRADFYGQVIEGIKVIVVISIMKVIGKSSIVIIKVNQELLILRKITQSILFL